MNTPQLLSKPSLRWARLRRKARDRSGFRYHAAPRSARSPPCAATTMSNSTLNGVHVTPYRCCRGYTMSSEPPPAAPPRNQAPSCSAGTARVICRGQHRPLVGAPRDPPRCRRRRSGCHVRCSAWLRPHHWTESEKTDDSTPR